MSGPIALAVHGGAGSIQRARLTPDAEASYHDQLATALRAGYDVLQGGGSGMDAVVAAVVILEDSPLFNAGRGSVLTRERSIEMDAAVMHGGTLAAGAVAAVRGVKNPVRLARAVMDQSSHVMLSGRGAEEFARRCDIEFETEEYFVTPRRVAQWRAQLAEDPDAQSLSESEDAPDVDWSTDHEFGTVGAVALDHSGNLAAATSTGGMTNKRWGRVGDSPVIGAGTYADNRSAAVSATGHGEMFLRAAACHELCARMRHGGHALRAAADAVIHEEVQRLGGQGGVIAIDTRAQIVFSANTVGMYRGCVDSDGRLSTAIFFDGSGSVDHPLVVTT